MAQRAALLKDGRVTVPSGYAADGYVITRRLIEEGRDRLVLRRPLYLPFPVRLLHGAADADVPVSVALRLMDHANSPDMRLMIVKGAGHRFSTPKCLKMISDAVGQVFRND